LLCSFVWQHGKLIDWKNVKYIPFIDKITDLYNTVKGINTKVKEVDPLTGIDSSTFFNQTHRALEEIRRTLTLVQIGIAWVIPIDILKRTLDFQLN
jgi:hypothetical protein